jgi:hypothetical protein
VEYTFKSADREEPITLVLGDNSISVRSLDSETAIPYAGITRVQLCRGSRGLYKTILHFDGGKPLVINNQPYVADNSVDQSRLYSTFIRVLHYHLKDKSSATYSIGYSMDSLARMGILGVAISFGVSFLANFLGFDLINPVASAFILTGVSAAGIFLLYAGQLPKTYIATNIPLELLP